MTPRLGPSGPCRRAHSASAGCRLFRRTLGSWLGTPPETPRLGTCYGRVIADLPITTLDVAAPPRGSAGGWRRPMGTGSPSGTWASGQSWRTGRTGESRQWPSARGRTLATGHADGTILLWPVPAPVPDGRWSESEANATWDAMTDDLPANVYPALWQLTDYPAEAVQFLRGKAALPRGGWAGRVRHAPRRPGQRAVRRPGGGHEEAARTGPGGPGPAAAGPQARAEPGAGGPDRGAVGRAGAGGPAARRRPAGDPGGGRAGVHRDRRGPAGAGRVGRPRVAAAAGRRG